MRIETKRLILREFVLGDWHAVSAYQQKERYWRYYEKPEGGAVDRRALVERFVAAQSERPRRSFQLAITLKAGGGLIGNIGVRLRRLVDFGIPDATFEADIGYELDPAHWRKGFAAEAAAAMVAFAFEDLAVHRVGPTASLKTRRRGGSSSASASNAKATCAKTSGCVAAGGTLSSMDCSPKNGPGRTKGSDT